MEFIAPQKATAAPDIIPNNSFWPDVDLAKFRSVMRVARCNLPVKSTAG